MSVDKNPLIWVPVLSKTQLGHPDAGNMGKNSEIPAIRRRTCWSCLVCFSRELQNANTNEGLIWSTKYLVVGIDSTG